MLENHYSNLRRVANIRVQAKAFRSDFELNIISVYFMHTYALVHTNMYSCKLYMYSMYY